MNWEIRVSKSVRKRIKRLPRKDRERIFEVLHEFGIDPWRGDIDKIDNRENLWRGRVGDYRIFYSVYINIYVIEVKEVKRRTSSTY